MEYEITASIPAHIRELLHSGETGEVLLVSSSGIYLRFGEQILLLCDESWGVLPIGIGVKDFEKAVSILRPQQGQPVTVSKDCLVFPFGTLRLVPQNLSDAKTCGAEPEIFQIRQAAEELAALRKERGISMLVLPLVLGYELRQQNPYCAQAGIYLEKLIHSLISGRQEEIHTCIEKLLGLGTGLTPSADDTLLGMIYVFRTLPFQAPEGVQLFPESVGQLCDRCTTQISAAYLKAMLSGAPFERMEQVFRGLCGEEPLNIYKLTEIGSNSGSEMLLGMLIALRI
jgi:hypothetical protein